jgi:putative serine protease PepD
MAAAYGLGALIASATSSKPSGPAPWLGIQMESLPLGGVVIATVTPGSPAESAGLEPGDVITEFDKRPVGAIHDVTATLNDLHAGQQVMIEVSRGSTSYTALVTLRKRPPGFP